MRQVFRRTSLLLMGAVVALGSVVASGSPHDFPPEEKWQEWRTVAERSDYRATGSYQETIDWLKRLAARSPQLELEVFGTSAEGRAMWLAKYSATGAFTPAAAGRTGKPVVMVQNGIHGGEIDGKDASLLLLRKLVLGYEEADALRSAIGTLLVIPVYNVDGHERVSPFNRANQNGPVEGMGFRTSAAGYDLNRDHLKLETPEARALIGLINTWRPHLHIDNHVTNGSDHAWVLTWSVVEAPQVAPPVGEWLVEQMPQVVHKTKVNGFRVGPYVSLRDPSDPSKGFSSRVAEPRFATGYWPLRHRPSILVENHAYKPYRDRVLANYQFMVALLEAIGRSGRQLVAAVDRAERLTVERGRAGAEPSPIVIAWRDQAEPDTIEFPVYDWTAKPSKAMGVPIVHYDREAERLIEVPWVHLSEPAVTADRPRGYLILPGWPRIEERLTGHGLRLDRLRRAAVVPAETLRATNPTFADNPYQGQTRVEAEIERRSESFEVPAGTLWVPADQRDFEVAVQLLEPQAPDSLFAWGYLSTALERKEYIDPRVLEPLVEEMLTDPAIAAEWQKALEDEAFASNPWARWEWWYRRTPYWDHRRGLLPILAVGDEGLSAVYAGLRGGAADRGPETSEDSSDPTSGH
ncbi:MAG: M14 family metallopeptidase [Acidobacteriota bacterium]